MSVLDRAGAWKPNHKVLVASTVGPALAAAMATLIPRLPMKVAAPVSALVTALVAYLAPKTPQGK